MTTRITGTTLATGITVTPTATRQTPEPSRPFTAVLNSGAKAVIQGAELAVSKLPGGPVIAAAVRSESANAASGVATGPGGSLHPTDPSGGSSTAGGLEGALAQQADNTMYYLQLQQQIQNETRAYTTASNVMKARHDSVKNAIGNIR